MPVITASAPGKMILLGEHAVVYDRPALAIPVHQVQAKVSVMADIRAPNGRVRLEAPDIQLSADLTGLPADHPLNSKGKADIDAIQQFAAFPFVCVQNHQQQALATGPNN